MPGIFINYRRDDAPGVAGRLYDHLARSFSRGQIFIDVDAIKPGLDFVKQLDAQVSQCDVLLAIIGPHWLNSADDKGKRRLDGDRDYVRIEIAAALKRDIPVIPVLIDGAEMPTEADLPEDLASLARRHALELRHTRFASDADAVVTALHTVLPKAKRPLLWPLVAAAVVACIAIGGAVWWLRSPDRQVAETPAAHEQSSQPANQADAMDEARRRADEARAKIAAAESQITQPKPEAPPQTPSPSPFGGMRDKNFIPDLSSSPSPSDDLSSGSVPGVKVALGQTLDAVTAAYPSGKPTTVSDKPALWLQSDGLYFFFTNDKALENIRFDAPFAGSVNGVKLGDSFDDVKKRLGQPLNSWDFGDDKANLYRVGDINLRFDVDKSGKVATIFYFKAN